MRLVSERSGWWVIVVHGLLAIGWIVMMPGGFSIDQPRFWMNRVLPSALLALCIGAVVRGLQGNGVMHRGVLLLLGTFWAALAVTIGVCFPASAIKAVPGVVLVGGLVWPAAFTPSMRRVRMGRPSVVVAAAAGLVVGVLAAVTQRAPDPDTRPVGEAVPVLGELSAGSADVGNGARLAVATGDVALQRGRYMVTVSPLLTFSSRSPDRCWVNVARKKDRVGPERVLGKWGRDAEGWVCAEYRDDDRSVLRVRARGEDEVELCTWSRLPVDVFSHLNSFTQLMVAGHKRLKLVFSPCGNAVEPQFMEYPVGAPARCAAMFADGSFRVLQASSAEKGPYRELAGGRLERTEPLTVTLRDEGRDVLTITWLDFAAQVSTGLSPTAGYGLPVNALEFSLDAERPESTMGMYMTLAGTSVGRGWDSVGHRAGVYRNRMVVRWAVH